MDGTERGGKTEMVKLGNGCRDQLWHDRLANGVTILAIDCCLGYRKEFGLIVQHTLQDVHLVYIKKLHQEASPSTSMLLIHHLFTLNLNNRINSL